MSTNKLFSSETSERYSLALLELAKENSLQDQVEKQMKLLSKIYVEMEDFQNFIKNPTSSISSQNERAKKGIKNIKFKWYFTKLYFAINRKKKNFFFLKKIIDTFLRLCSKEREKLKQYSSQQRNWIKINKKIFIKIYLKQ